MALETALGFAHRLIDVASQEKKIKTISLRILDSVVVRARFRLNRRFINVFYNSQTGTTAYSLIRSERRIFGADNTGGWHFHPKDKPTHLDFARKRKILRMKNPPLVPINVLRSAELSKKNPLGGKPKPKSSQTPQP